MLWGQAPRGPGPVRQLYRAGRGRARGTRRAPVAPQDPSASGRVEASCQVTSGLTALARQGRCLVWGPSLQTHSPGLGGGFHTHGTKIPHAVPGASIQHMLIGQLCGPGPGGQRGQGWTPSGPPSCEAHPLGLAERSWAVVSEHGLRTTPRYPALAAGRGGGTLPRGLATLAPKKLQQCSFSKAFPGGGRRGRGGVLTGGPRIIQSP